jgi:hypothetical protein
MTLLDTVATAIQGWPCPSQRGHDIAVPTHCLYPSNGIVYAYVSGGSSTFKVTDGGGAIQEFLSGNGNSHEEMAILRAASKPQGLLVSEGGLIHSPLVNLDQLAGTIALVANASKEAALTLVTRFTPAPKKNFRELLARLIDGERAHGRFIDVSTHRSVVGASTKSHKFDYEILFASRKRLLLDTAVPEASSINSVLAANLDIRQADLPETIQRIVYDDEDQWKSADLALLGLGATVVPFTKVRPVLSRLAA